MDCSTDKRTISESSLVEKDGNYAENEGRPNGGGYPKSVFFIIGNEFCERFSYYGMRTILTLYLNEFLLYNKNDSTMIYHIFSMLCYFTPLIGAFVSDSFLGKFKTIFYISIVYVAGNIVLSLSAFPGYDFHSVIAILGLLFIAFGTGGIKPCVAAFGGDQFRPDQDKQLERFFSVFYISINAGSLISTYVTPILREDVQCWGKDCYALAFGVPAGLMIVALILFLIGRPLYKMNPPTGNVVVQVSSCIWHALRNKKRGEKREHWLDNADDKYEKSLIDDIKCLLHVLVLYLPLPVFWALFDQQGSRWLIQATQMDGHITENFRIKPDQIQVVNPLLIVACIPLFQFVIYPVFNKIGLLKSPLQKMTVGGLLAAASFVVAFFVELALEKTLPIYPTDGNGQINLINNLPCQLNITNNLKQEPIFLNSGDMYRDMDVKAGEVEYTFQTWGCSLTNSSATYHHSLKNLAIDNIFIYENRSALEFLTRPDSLDKPKNAETNVRIFYNLPVAFDPNSTFTLTNTENKVFNLLFHATDTAGFTNYTLVPPDVYSLSLPDTNNSVITLETKSGGCYIVQIMGNNTHDKAFVYTMVEPNTLSLLVQIPQYIVITFGEIMFSITGLEFSYSQAPPSMKSVLQAAWLMTVAFGNLIVVIVASAGHMKQSYEFIMFAGLMAVDMIIFAIMAYFYKSIIKPNNEEADTLPEKKGSYALNSASSKGKENGAYTNDANSNM